MPTSQSRWGFHPVDYPTFLKLRVLHRRYWETVRAVARFVRWDRKTVRRQGPAPRYCPAFVQERGRWEERPQRDHPTWRPVCRWRPKTLIDRGVVEAYRTARMPAESPEGVKELSLSQAEIERLFDEVEAWFKKEAQSATHPASHS